MGRASVLVVLTVLACASPGRPAALGWSLGGEAHVFVPGERFARDLYRRLTGSSRLSDTLRQRPLVSVNARFAYNATVLSTSGAAPGRLTLARFHAPLTCGYADVVTELVLAFPPGGAAGRSTPPSHGTVVALLEGAPFVGGAGSPSPALQHSAAVTLITRVTERADSVTRGGAKNARTALLRPLELDPDQAADAGEVAPLTRGLSRAPRYAVGLRARFRTEGGDTLLVTGVAVTDLELRELSWVVRPLRARLTGGMIRSAGVVRYSLRGTVAGAGGGTLVLLDEIADVSARDSRATAIDPVTRRVVAAQPLALRCP